MGSRERSDHSHTSASFRSQSLPHSHGPDEDEERWQEHCDDQVRPGRRYRGGLRGQEQGRFHRTGHACVCRRRAAQKSGKFVIPGLAMIKTRKKPATKAKKMLMFGEMKLVKAKPAKTVVKAFAAKAIKDQF